MKKEPKCPRTECKNKANYDKTYGILPCDACQAKDTKIGFGRPESYSLAKSHRVQKLRDQHSADLLQPFESGKPNPDYFKKYPSQVGTYGVKEELKKA